jgi:hypothetical protein
MSHPLTSGRRSPEPLERRPPRTYDESARHEERPMKTDGTSGNSVEIMAAN